MPMPKWFPIGLPSRSVGWRRSPALSLPPLAAFAIGALALALARRGGAWRAGRRRSRGSRPRPAEAGGADVLGVRAGADREAADAASDRHAHRAGELCQPRGAARRCRGCEAGVHFAHLIRAPAFVEAVTRDAGRRRGAAGALHRRTRAGSGSSRRGWDCCRPGTRSGRRRMAIVQIEDRTETRRAEQLRSDFIANASHELRTPLASIIGYIETLQHHARERSRGARALPRDHGARGRADAAAGGRPDVAQPDRDERAPAAGGGLVAEPDRRRERRGAAAGGARSRA